MAKPTTTPAQPSAPKRRRADAERSVAAILDAAREALLDAVMERSVANVAEATRSAEPERGEPVEALERVLRATWRELARFHALLAINTARLSAEELRRRHLPVLDQLQPLVQRGQKQGVFRSDLSVAWHLAVIRAIVHAASHESQGGRIPESRAEAAMLSTALSAISPPQPRNS